MTYKIQLVPQETVDYLQKEGEHGLLCCMGGHAMLLNVPH